MKKYFKIFLVISLLVFVIYSSGRLYYAITAGFTISNITSDFAYNEKWDMLSLSNLEKERVNQILAQKFSYLGKGCQSYVFLSEDGEYVLKFVKIR